MNSKIVLYSGKRLPCLIGLHKYDEEEFSITSDCNSSQQVVYGTKRCIFCGKYKTRIISYMQKT